MTKNKKKIISIISIIVCFVLIVGLISYDFITSSNTVKSTHIAMGTVVSASITGEDAKKASDAIEETLAGLENACLSWRVEDSDVWRINKRNGEDVSVSRDTAYWISEALDVSADSDGAFDITVGKLTQLWNIGSEEAKVPSSGQIKALIENVDYKKVSATYTSVKINQGQAIDLGAVGKGIACDVIRDLLDSYNIKDAVVSVGGSILIYNQKANVGIADPENSSKSIATIEIDDKNVSTSGDYERFFESDGKKYHHILDPETGYPAVTDLRSVTVICNSGLDADAISTACFVMGYKRSLELLKKYDAEAVFIFDNNTVSITDGIKDEFKLTSDKYTVE